MVSYDDLGRMKRVPHVSAWSNHQLADEVGMVNGNPKNTPAGSLNSEAWRAWFLQDYDAAWRTLTDLHETDLSRFLQVSRRLAADRETIVAEAGLRQLGFRGTVEDAEAERIAREQLIHGDPALRDAALLALGRIGLPSTFEFLAPYVTGESAVALLAFAGQARGADQRARVLDVARNLVCADNGQVRIAAVRIVRGFSSVIAEQELLLRAAHAHLDAVTFSALRKADTRVLPGLRDLQARLLAGSAQWQDVSDAIEAIERWSAQA